MRRETWCVTRLAAAISPAHSLAHVGVATVASQSAGGTQAKHTDALSRPPLSAPFCGVSRSKPGSVLPSAMCLLCFPTAVDGARRTWTQGARPLIPAGEERSGNAGGEEKERKKKRSCAPATRRAE